MSVPAVRPMRRDDQDAVWEILRPVFRAGETYAMDMDITRDEALEYWTGATAGAYVVDDGVQVLGTYYMTRNQRGGGAHVCNCGYVTADEAQGRGIARLMLEDSLARAPRMGFRAMQYNCVVADNSRAITTWEKAGFSVVGRLPGAFQHPRKGFIDALVMYKTL